jgi:hypothetical protein
MEVAAAVVASQMVSISDTPDQFSANDAFSFDPRNRLTRPVKEN